MYNIMFTKTERNIGDRLCHLKKVLESSRSKNTNLVVRERVHHDTPVSTDMRGAGQHVSHGRVGYSQQLGYHLSGHMINYHCVVIGY